MTGQTVLYTFVWEDSTASDVVVTGTFDNWSKSTPLTKSEGGHLFSATVPLPKGNKALFKYVVDGNWLTAEHYKIEKDQAGIENNVIYPEDLENVTCVEEHNDGGNANNAVDNGANAAAGDLYAQKGGAPSQSTLSNSNETLSAVNTAKFDQIKEEQEASPPAMEQTSINQNIEESLVSQVMGTQIEKAKETNGIDQHKSTGKTKDVEGVIGVLPVEDSKEEIKEHNLDKSNILHSVDLNEKKLQDKEVLSEKGKSITRTNTGSSVIVSIPSPKKKSIQHHALAAEKSNTESSAFTNIDSPSQPDIKEAENGLSQVAGEKDDDNAIILNSLHLDDLESSASFKSISSNEIFSSTHGTLSNFNMQDSNEHVDKTKKSVKSDNDVNDTGSLDYKPSPRVKQEHKSLLSLSFVSRFKRIFK